MSDYISLLNDQETEYIGTLIGGKNIRHFFQKEPGEFAKIRPGFRPNAISDADAVELVSRYRNRAFISSLLTKWINKWFDEIHSFQVDLIKKGSAEQEALIPHTGRQFICRKYRSLFQTHSFGIYSGAHSGNKIRYKKTPRRAEPGNRLNR